VNPATCPICQTPLESEAHICPSCGFDLEVAHTTLPLPSTLHEGRYALERLLGQGGFGLTYRARDTLLNRNVALKEFFPEGSSRATKRVRPPKLLGALGFAESRQTFLEEAGTLAQFSHPGIVRVWDAFSENDTAYMVMELLEGQTLEERIRQQGKLNHREVLDLALHLLDALEGVHAAGMLHRDIKPDNIFLCSDGSVHGRIVLIDFGSARAFAQGQTTTVTRLVTQGYAPPEQYASKAKFGPYTDFYALGATLFHALSSELAPSAPDRMMGTSLPSLHGDTLPLGMRDQALPLERAIVQALALRVEERPQNVAEFKALLSAPAAFAFDTARVPFDPLEEMWPRKTQSRTAQDPYVPSPLVESLMEQSMMQQGISGLGLERIKLERLITWNLIFIPIGALVYHSLRVLLFNPDTAHYQVDEIILLVALVVITAIIGFLFKLARRIVAGFVIGFWVAQHFIGSWSGIILLLVFSFLLAANMAQNITNQREI
jgi:serine/threonine protein kinase